MQQSIFVLTGKFFKDFRSQGGSALRSDKDRRYDRQDDRQQDRQQDHQHERPLGFGDLCRFFQKELKLDFDDNTANKVN